MINTVPNALESTDTEAHYGEAIESIWSGDPDLTSSPSNELKRASR